MTCIHPATTLSILAPKPTPPLSRDVTGSPDQPCPSHRRQIHTYPFAFQASARRRPLLSARGLVGMPKVPSKQLPGFSRGIRVIPPRPRTECQEGLLPAPSEAQGLREQRGFAAAGYPQEGRRVDLSLLCFGSKSYAPQTITNCHTNVNK